jgi:hypothetical protein
MRYSWQVFLIGIFLTFASCRSSKNLPKTSSIEIDSTLVKQALEIKNLKMKLRTPADTLTFYVNVVTQTDCPEVVEENKKLHKKQRTWQKIAGILLVIATGNFIYGLTTN